MDREISKKTVSGTEVFSKALPKIDFSGESVKIKEGEIIKGIPDKSLFGDEEGLLIKEIDRKFGRNIAFDTIRKAFNLGKNYLTKRGITISLDDFDVEQKIIDISEEIVKRADEKTKEIIEEYNRGTLEVIRGKTPEESREIKILKILNEVRTKIGDLFGSPEDSLTKKKLRKVWLNALARGANRVDAVCIVLNYSGGVERLEHYENIT